MEEVKITFFKDSKITKGNPGALLEFSTGEIKVVTHRNPSDFTYFISKAISEVVKSKAKDIMFKDL